MYGPNILNKAVAPKRTWNASCSFNVRLSIRSLFIHELVSHVVFGAVNFRGSAVVFLFGRS